MMNVRRARTGWRRIGSTLTAALLTAGLLKARVASAGEEASAWTPLMLSLNQPGTASPAVATTSPVLTPSQLGNPQLNQLFELEATPDICAAGEGYLSGQFSYVQFRRNGSSNKYRFQVQGQYGVTNQIAVGGYIPGIVNEGTGYFAGESNGGTGDVVAYAQFKFDRLIDPKLFSLTAQVDVELPTGDENESRDRDKFAVRPLALAYKDFGRVGPGRLGAYGLLGFTITDDADVRGAWRPRTSKSGSSASWN